MKQLATMNPWLLKKPPARQKKRQERIQRTKGGIVDQSRAKP
jgi:hypothetical protein